MVHLVDSSVWVALFLEKDNQHIKAVARMKRQKGTVCVPYCVVNETVTVLAYKHSKEQADQFLSFLENAQDIEIVEDDFQEEATFFRTLNARISFTDAVLVLLTQKLSAELVTFDKQLERLANRF
jgi:predicted nucleic acid-binding protein